MLSFIKNERVSMLRKSISLIIVISFMFTSIITPANAQAISGLNLPVPGAMVLQSPAFVPVLLKGMTVHPDNPMKFDFILDSGNTDLEHAEMLKESDRLVKYFLASMTVPKDDLWVNLSPEEPDRIVPSELGKTELGRDLLAQDYILKQLTASLMYPEDELGQKFWDKVYKQAQEKFGTTEIPVNTFNKVWILPESATVYEHENTVYVVESKLKVMTDSDYLSRTESAIPAKAGILEDSGNTPAMTNSIIKEIIIPAIEKEVNEGENFAPLRQIYHSLILAKWYKETIKTSLLSQVYVDQNKVMGIELSKSENGKANGEGSSIVDSQSSIVETIYDQYMEAYKKGVYDFIKEEYDSTSQQIIPRKYFSGGIKDAHIDLAMTTDRTAIEKSVVGQSYDLAMAIEPRRDGSDNAMTVKEIRGLIIDEILLQNPSKDRSSVKKGLDAVALTFKEILGFLMGQDIQEKQAAYLVEEFMLASFKENKNSRDAYKDGVSNLFIDLATDSLEKAAKELETMKKERVSKARIEGALKFAERRLEKLKEEIEAANGELSEEAEKQYMYLQEHLGATSEESEKVPESLKNLSDFNSETPKTFGDIVFLPKDADLYIVGDTHGDPISTRNIIINIIAEHQESDDPFDAEDDEAIIKEFETIIKKNPKLQIVFLGDYINNGLGNIENLLFVLRLSTDFKENIVLLSGNHEFRETYVTAAKEYFNTHLVNATINEVDGKDPSKGQDYYGHIRIDLISRFGIKRGEELYEKFEQWGRNLPFVAFSGKGIMMSHSLGVPKTASSNEKSALDFDQVSFKSLSKSKSDSNDGKINKRLGYDVWRKKANTLHASMVNNRKITQEILKRFSEKFGVNVFVIGHSHYRSGDVHAEAEGDEGWSSSSGEGVFTTLASSSKKSRFSGHYMPQEQDLERDPDYRNKKGERGSGVKEGRIGETEAYYAFFGKENEEVTKIIKTDNLRLVDEAMLGWIKKSIPGTKEWARYVIDGRGSNIFLAGDQIRAVKIIGNSTNIDDGDLWRLQKMYAGYGSYKVEDVAGEMLTHEQKYKGLIKIITSGDHWYHGIQNVIDKIGDLGDTRAIEHLIYFLGWSYIVQLSAEEALRKLGRTDKQLQIDHMKVLLTRGTYSFGDFFERFTNQRIIELLEKFGFESLWLHELDNIKESGSLDIDYLVLGDYKQILRDGFNVNIVIDDPVYIIATDEWEDYGYSSIGLARGETLQRWSNETKILKKKGEIRFVKGEKANIVPEMIEIIQEGRLYADFAMTADEARGLIRAQLSPEHHYLITAVHVQRVIELNGRFEVAYHEATERHFVQGNDADFVADYADGTLKDGRSVPDKYVPDEWVDGTPERIEIISLDSVMAADVVEVKESTKRYLDEMRKDYLEGTDETSSDRFRELAHLISDEVVKELLKKVDPQKAVVVLPWRAALAMSLSFKKYGFKNIWHIGLYRDETTHEPIEYHQGVWQLPDGVSADEVEVIVADPMLATGGSIGLTIINIRNSMKISAEQMTIASIVSSPEGTERISREYSVKEFITASLDEGIDENAFIVPGLGDFGDRYMDQISADEIRQWFDRGVLNFEDLTALLPIMFRNEATVKGAKALARDMGIDFSGIDENPDNDNDSMKEKLTAGEKRGRIINGLAKAISDRDARDGFSDADLEDARQKKALILDTGVGKSPQQLAQEVSQALKAHKKRKSVEGGVAVTVVGGSGTGKSTVSRAIAKELGATNIGVGLIYRAMSLIMIQQGVEPTAEAIADALLENGKSILKDITLTSDDNYYAGIRYKDKELAGEVEKERNTIEKTLNAQVWSEELHALIAVFWISEIEKMTLEGKDVVAEMRPREAKRLEVEKLNVFLAADVLVRAERRADDVINLKGLDRAFDEFVDGRSASATARDPQVDVSDKSMASNIGGAAESDFDSAMLIEDEAAFSESDERFMFDHFQKLGLLSDELPLREMRAKVINLLNPAPDNPATEEEISEVVMTEYISGPYLKGDTIGTDIWGNDIKYMKGLFDREFEKVKASGEIEIDEKSARATHERLIAGLLSLKDAAGKSYYLGLTNVITNRIAIRLTNIVLFGSVENKAEEEVLAAVARKANEISRKANMNSLFANKLKQFLETNDDSEKVRLLEDAIRISLFAAAPNIWFSDIEVHKNENEAIVRVGDLQKEALGIPLSLNSVKQFFDEVLRAKPENDGFKLLYFLDDNGDLIYHLHLMQAYLNENPNLQITVVAKGERVAIDTTVDDLEHELQYDEFSFLKEQEGGRFAVLREGPVFGGVNFRQSSKEMIQVLKECDAVVGLGQTVTETANGINKPAYHQSYVHANVHQTFTGLPRGALYFTRVPASRRYYESGSSLKIFEKGRGKGWDVDNAEDLPEVVRTKMKEDAKFSNIVNFLINGVVNDWDEIIAKGAFTFDVEKTLARSMDNLPQETIDILAVLLRQGVRVAIITGMPTEPLEGYLVKPLIKVLDGDAEAVNRLTIYTNGGAKKYAVASDSELIPAGEYNFKHAIQEEVVSPIKEALLEMSKNKFGLGESYRATVEEWRNWIKGRFPGLIIDDSWVDGNGWIPEVISSDEFWKKSTEGGKVRIPAIVTTPSEHGYAIINILHLPEDPVDVRGNVEALITEKINALNMNIDFRTYSGGVSAIDILNLRTNKAEAIIDFVQSNELSVDQIYFFGDQFYVKKEGDKTIEGNDESVAAHPELKGVMTFSVDEVSPVNSQVTMHIGRGYQATIDFFNNIFARILPENQENKDLVETTDVSDIDFTMFFEGNGDDIQAGIDKFKLSAAKIAEIKELDGQVAAIVREALSQHFADADMEVMNFGSSERFTFVGDDLDFDIAAEIYVSEEKLLEGLKELVESGTLVNLLSQAGIDVTPADWTKDGFVKKTNALNNRGTFYVFALDSVRRKDGKRFGIDIPVIFDQRHLEDNDQGLSLKYQKQFLAKMEAVGEEEANQLRAEIRFLRYVLKNIGAEAKRPLGGFVSINAEQLIMAAGSFETAMELVYKSAFDAEGNIKKIKDVVLPIAKVSDATDGDFFASVSQENWEKLVQFSQLYMEKDAYSDDAMAVEPQKDGQSEINDLTVLFDIDEGSTEEEKHALRYSFFKLGRYSELQEYSELLVERIREQLGTEIDKDPDQWVIVNHIADGLRPASGFLINKVAESLKLTLVGEETVVNADVFGGKEMDYSKLTTEKQRTEYIAGRSRFTDPDSVKGKNVIFIDDSTVTGTYVREMSKLAERSDVSSYHPFVVVRLNPSEGSDSSYENRFNRTAFNEGIVEALTKVLNGPKNVYTTKLVKYIFELDEGDFRRLVEGLETFALCNLFFYGIKKKYKYIDVLSKKIVRAVAVRPAAHRQLFGHYNSGDIIDFIVRNLKSNDYKIPVELMAEMIDRMEAILDVPMVQGVELDKEDLDMLVETMNTMASQNTSARELSASLLSDSQSFTNIASDERIIAVLTRLLQDDDWVVRENAARTLGSLRNEIAIKPLFDRLRNTEMSSYDLRSFVWALMQFDNKKAAQALVDFLIESYLAGNHELFERIETNISDLIESSQFARAAFFENDQIRRISELGLQPEYSLSDTERGMLDIIQNSRNSKQEQGGEEFLINLKEMYESDENIFSFLKEMRAFRDLINRGSITKKEIDSSGFMAVVFKVIFEHWEHHRDVLILLLVFLNERSLVDSDTFIQFDVDKWLSKDLLGDNLNQIAAKFGILTFLKNNGLVPRGKIVELDADILLGLIEKIFPYNPSNYHVVDPFLSDVFRGGFISLEALNDVDLLEWLSEKAGDAKAMEFFFGIHYGIIRVLRNMLDSSYLDRSLLKKSKLIQKLLLAISADDVPSSKKHEGFRFLRKIVENGYLDKDEVQEVDMLNVVMMGIEEGATLLGSGIGEHSALILWALVGKGLVTAKEWQSQSINQRLFNVFRDKHLVLFDQMVDLIDYLIEEGLFDIAILEKYLFGPEFKEVVGQGTMHYPLASSENSFAASVLYLLLKRGLVDTDYILENKIINSLTENMRDKNGITVAHILSSFSYLLQDDFERVVKVLSESSGVGIVEDVVSAVLPDLISAGSITPEIVKKHNIVMMLVSQLRADSFFKTVGFLRRINMLLEKDLLEGADLRIAERISSLTGVIISLKKYTTGRDADGGEMTPQSLLIDKIIDEVSAGKFSKGDEAMASLIPAIMLESSVQDTVDMEAVNAIHDAAMSGWGIVENVIGIISVLSLGFYVNYVWRSDTTGGLIGRFKNRDLVKRQKEVEAVEAIGKSGATDEQMVDGYIKALRSSNSDVRKEAVKALGKLGDESAVDPLLELLGDKNWRVREAVVEAIGKSGATDEQMVDGYIKALGSSFSGIRIKAVSALGKLGDGAVEPLIELLGESDDNVFKAVVVALGELGDARAVEPLIELLGESDDDVLKTVVEVLGSLGDVRAVEPVIEWLSSTIRKANVLVGTEALVALGDTRAIGPLRKLFKKLSHLDWSDIIAEALLSLGDDRAYKKVLKNRAESSKIISSYSSDKRKERENRLDAEEEREKESDDYGILGEITSADMSRDSNWAEDDRDTYGVIYYRRISRDSDNAMSAPGGIDLNNIEVDRKGMGTEIQFDPVVLEDMSNITGFVPVIINLTPINSILPLLGFNDESGSGSDTKEVNRRGLDVYEDRKQVALLN